MKFYFAISRVSTRDPRMDFDTGIPPVQALPCPNKQFNIKNHGP